MLSDPRVRMLVSTTRNLFSIFGLVYIVALFSTLHAFYFFFFALAFIGLIYLCYRVQIAFHEVFGSGASEINDEVEEPQGSARHTEWNI